MGCQHPPRPDTVQGEVPEHPETVAGLARFVAERFPDTSAVRFKDGDEWRERSYGEIVADAEARAAAAVEEGIQPGDRVCVLADTSPQWATTAFAIWSTGAVV